jgi:hypothetical protein
VNASFAMSARLNGQIMSVDYWAGPGLKLLFAASVVIAVPVDVAILNLFF